ncbi:MAG: RDD family protein [Acidobacteriota bacterium]|nr:MAG: RDD family protein [Acidobacteriota bacterium]
MNDTIREELQSKITVRPRTDSIPANTFEEIPLPQPMPATPMPATPMPATVVTATGNRAAAVAVSPAVDPQTLPKRQITSHLEPAKTSPTLVRFQDPNKTNIPEWRDKLRESVKQRKNGGVQAAEADNVRPMPASVTQQKTAEQSPQPKIDVSDERLAKALARIENSRRSFLKNDGRQPLAQPISRPTPVPVRPEVKQPVFVPPSPVALPRTVSEVAPIRELKHDTNKLPELKSVEMEVKMPEVTITTSRIEVDVDRSGPLEQNLIHIPAARSEAEEADAVEFEAPDEIEDLAPFSMRFAAGLFDIVFSAIAAALLLSPIAFYGFDWVSPLGIGLFFSAMALVLFTYSTLTLGFVGKTLGLRLFALELVDAVENEYPTMKQAAINSAVYIASMLCLGAGFVTIFFNDENRAAHDLVSGTILVKEF